MHVHTFMVTHEPLLSLEQSILVFSIIIVAQVFLHTYFSPHPRGEPCTSVSPLGKNLTLQSLPPPPPLPPHTHLGKNLTSVHKLHSTSKDLIVCTKENHPNICMHQWVVFSNLKFWKGSFLFNLLFTIFNCWRILMYAMNKQVLWVEWLIQQPSKTYHLHVLNGGGHQGQDVVTHAPQCLVAHILRVRWPFALWVRTECPCVICKNCIDFVMTKDH